MSRLARFALLWACAFGIGFPSSSEAGVIPWAYDALFGPVGSMQRSYSTPYYTGYSGYVGTNYQPAAYSYGYATNGCSSCQQSSYYSQAQSGCGCSPCGSIYGSSCGSGCSGGGCASGNCAVNSAPAGGLSPIADPSNYSRGIESRLEAIEKQLNIVPPREHTGTRPRTYDDDRFAPSKARPRTNDGFDDGSAVPARDGVGTGTRRSGTGTVIEDENFTRPSIRNPARGTTTEPENDPFPANAAPRGNTDGTSTGPRDTFKANTEKPATELNVAPKPDPDLVIPEKKPAPTGAAVEETNGPQTLRLDSRITSKAVSLRERQTIVVGFQKPVIARTKSPASNWAGNPRATDLAQHR